VKVWVAFAYENYYPMGEQDVIGVYSTKEKAYESFTRLKGYRTTYPNRNVECLTIDEDVY